MVFSLLGKIRIGDATWTGPTASSEGRKASLPEHAVARGKPVVQDTGDELDTKTLEFLFDETFCDPKAEFAKLEDAFAGRTPLPLVGGDGAFDGTRWLIEAVNPQTLKTAPNGRVVRIKVSVSLKEAPVADMLGLARQIARAGAPALTGIINPGARK